MTCNALSQMDDSPAYYARVYCSCSSASVSSLDMNDCRKRLVTKYGENYKNALIHDIMCAPKPWNGWAKYAEEHGYTLNQVKNYIMKQCQPWALGDLSPTSLT